MFKSFTRKRLLIDHILLCQQVFYNVIYGYIEIVKITIYGNFCC